MDGDPLLKTRQVARSLGVSVSTIKRWVDLGELPATRTLGKHRLIRLSNALQFARQQGFPVEGLERLGASDLVPVEAIDDSLRSALLESLRRGEMTQSKRILHSAFSSGVGAVALSDKLIRPCMEKVGQEWMVGVVDVYQEHQATQAVAAALFEMIDQVSRSQVNPSPLALGATAEGDPYQIAVLLGELVLREAGWNVRNLGSNLPLRSLALAVMSYQPKLVFLSVNHMADLDRFLREYPSFHEKAAACDTAVILGGQALGPELRACLGHVSYGEHMIDLSEFARRLAPASVVPNSVA